jgi:hypothetical protein
MTWSGQVLVLRLQSLQYLLWSPSGVRVMEIYRYVGRLYQVMICSLAIPPIGKKCIYYVV